MIASRSLLTSLIGFLIGFIIYPDTIFLFLCGGVGYFVGLLLDNVDVKNQLDLFYFNNVHATQDVFQPDDIPEAVIIYSRKEKKTIVQIDFRVDSKPQDFRLSVLKNFQEFDFRIIEDANKTTFSLLLDYPDCNYPQIELIDEQKTELHFDIRERSKDFQTALQKIVPGLRLTIVAYPDLYREIGIDNSMRSLSTDFQIPPSSPSSIRPEFDDRRPSLTVNGINRLNENEVHNDTLREQMKETTTSEVVVSEPWENSSSNEIDGSAIMDDLLGNTGSNQSPINVITPASSPDFPNMSPKDVDQLKDMNAKTLKSFLDEDNPPFPKTNLKTANELKNDSPLIINDSEVADQDEDSGKVKIDYSSLLDSSEENKTLDDFTTHFVSKLDDASQKDTDSKLQDETKEEMVITKNALDTDTTTEDSTP
ncbi:MAG: DUF2273 domain-containing protein [Candidatus Hodarchaeales archaeon]|jgi:hypothetical protein